MMHDMRNLGANICRLKNEHDLTYQQLADELDMDYWDIRGICNGQVYMTGKDYSNLIKFFNCTSDDLFKNDFNTYNKYVFGGKLKSEDEVRIADAILDQVEQLIMIEHARHIDRGHEEKKIDD